MFDNKFVISLIGISIAVLAICNLAKKAEVKEIVEPFLGNLPSMKVKLERSIGCKDGVDFYSIPAYQSMLSPRFSNTDYGANIQYNLPDYKNLGTPCDPLMMGDMVSESYNPPQTYRNTTRNMSSQVKENFCGGCSGGPTLCGKGGSNLHSFNQNFAGPVSDYAAGNFNQVTDEIYSSSTYPEANSMFPVGDMKTINGLGEACQAVVYDRYIYANRNSRLRSLGDPIRGDLAITPCSGNWFTPSVQPNIDLQEGALNVMGGFDCEQQHKLSALIYASSGGTETAIGGVNLASEFNTGLCAGGGDIVTTAYP
jgi:hypothetical protein